MARRGRHAATLDVRQFAETFAHELGLLDGREHAIFKDGVWVDENWTMSPFRCPAS